MNTGYYIVQYRINGRWATMTYWQMAEAMLPDFLLHVLDLHNGIDERDDIRVKRICFSYLCEQLAVNPDLDIYEYHGLHIHTCQ